MNCIQIEHREQENTGHGDKISPKRWRYRSKTRYAESDFSRGHGVHVPPWDRSNFQRFVDLFRDFGVTGNQRFMEYGNPLDDGEMRPFVVAFPQRQRDGVKCAPDKETHPYQG